MSGRRSSAESSRSGTCFGGRLQVTLCSISHCKEVVVAATVFLFCFFLQHCWKREKVCWCCCDFFCPDGTISIWRGQVHKGISTEGGTNPECVVQASCLPGTAQDHARIKQLLSLQAAHLCDFSKQALTTLGAVLPFNFPLFSLLKNKKGSRQGFFFLSFFSFIEQHFLQRQCRHLQFL